MREPHQPSLILELNSLSCTYIERHSFDDKEEH